MPAFSKMTWSGTPVQMAVDAALGPQSKPMPFWICRDAGGGFYIVFRVLEGFLGSVQCVLGSLRYCLERFRSYFGRLNAF